MTKIYACLIGEWVCLNDEPTCTVGDNYKDPYIWWEENAEIFNPERLNKEHTFYELPYVNIHYKDKTYRVNPVLIQKVIE